jgi:hypothetical protein
MACGIDCIDFEILGVDNSCFTIEEVFDIGKTS